MLLQLISLLSALQLASASDGCLERRGVFDVGSGSTKVLIADIDTCKGTVRGAVLRDSRKIGYSKDLSRADAEGRFSDEIQSAGLEALRELKTAAELLEPKPVRYTGVATQAFRKAANGEKLAQRIHDAIGVTVKVIPQKEEALLGFKAATLASQIPSAKPVAVWDIGGGSMQVTVRAQGAPRVFENTHASETFREAVVRDVKKLDPNSHDSPNPLTQEQQTAAVKLARKLAKDWSRKTGAKPPQGVTVLAIGGVLRDSVLGQIRKLKGNDKLEDFTLDDVRAVLKARAGQDDDHVREATGSDYFRTEVTNAALVLGFMETLGFKRVKVVSSSIAEGVAVTPEYWKLAK